MRVNQNQVEKVIQKGDLFRERFVVSEAVYQGFKRVFKDTNTLHTDSAYGRRFGFKGEVMYGNILCGFLSYFVGNCLPMKNVVLHAQQINFAKPVYLNDNLELRAEVLDVFDSVGVIELGFGFWNQHQSEVARGKIQIGLLR